MRTKFNYLTVYWMTKHGRAGVVMHGDSESNAKYLDPMPRSIKSADGLGLVGYFAHASFEAALKDAKSFEARGF